MQAGNIFPCRYFAFDAEANAYDDITVFLRNMATTPIRDSWLRLRYQGELLTYSSEVHQLPQGSIITVQYADQTWVPLPVPPPAKPFPPFTFVS